MSLQIGFERIPFKRAFCLAIVLLTVAGIARSQQADCSILGAPEVKVTIGDISFYRLPSASDLCVSASCRAAAQIKIDSWHKDDLADFEHLAKRLCSYKVGWMERVPNTCQAGGPPPICKVDHWIRVGPNIALGQYRSEELKTYAQRRRELISDACKCRRAELDAGDDANNSKSTAQADSVPNYQSFYQMNTVPCNNGTCPPGTSCRASVCRADTTVEHGQKMAIDKGLDELQTMGRDELQKMALAAISKKLLEFSETFGGKIVSSGITGLFEYTTLSTDRDLYESEMRQVAADGTNLRNLYQEYDSYIAGKPARGPNMILPEIVAQKAQLSDHVQQLNIAYLAVVRSRELHSDECYEVFEYQQQKINQMFADFMTQH